MLNEGSPKYTIERHSGRGNDRWKTAYETRNEVKARVELELRFKQAKQGGLRLLKDGEVIEEKHRPRRKP